MHIQDSIVELQARVSKLPDDPEITAVDQMLSDALQLVEPIQQLFEGVRDDLEQMDQTMPAREQTMSERDRERFRDDREQLGGRLADLELEFDQKTAELAGLQDRLAEQSSREVARQLISWVADVLQLVDRLVLIPARSRLEAVTVDSISLESGEAFRIALANRLDFMNGRAALVDRWRLIQVEADSLQSVLNMTASGDIRTARNNALSFRAPTGNFRMGLEFDAPFTRLLERNAYRESLIEYQQARREFIQSRDRLHLGLRELLRRIEQLRQNLEIQRLAVAIAIRRVDQTQLELNPPRLAPATGRRS